MSDISLCLIDCTGVSQTGLKMLARAIPALPTDLREQYNPKMQYATFDVPCPPGFDDAMRAADMRRSDGGLVEPERVGILTTYQPDPAIEHRSISILRREHGVAVTVPAGCAVAVAVPGSCCGCGGGGGGLRVGEWAIERLSRRHATCSKGQDWSEMSSRGTGQRD